MTLFRGGRRPEGGQRIGNYLRDRKTLEDQVALNDQLQGHIRTIDYLEAEIKALESTISQNTQLVKKMLQEVDSDIARLHHRPMDQRGVQALQSGLGRFGDHRLEKTRLDEARPF